MATFFDNFNFDPADNKETTASYTVPAGMYAIVTATLSVTAYSFLGSSGGGIDSINTSTNFATSNGSENIKVELRLKEGSILTKATTVALDTSTTFSTSPITLYVSDLSIAELLVDGAVVSKIRTPCMASVRTGTLTTGQVDLEVNGTADVTWHISEYNKQGA